ncbi:ImmA/IrrE family metallo-endopeptidase [Paenibacillus albidus]|uniref:ImmA/IrrE family metallo-endopeptidase n=1 Tax=Paenibacillus albidus TaxID=2041023 RepID=UPI001BE89DB7|nr:ImmA/IrrE family metallo-endopeptidase [Paenibacillus albidus]MBT2288007.1 ImmA/IrrE family metallo-endopeptidase [Paenibacillus albidus]
MEINRLIRRLLRKHKTNCPYRLAAALNIEVWFEDLGEGTRGMFRRTLRRKYIVIHSGLSEAWKRVICAHELAHALLHPGISRFWMDEHTFFFVGRYEREANYFAVRLLTSGDTVEDGDTVYNLFHRNGIPDEMIQFYI